MPSLFSLSLPHNLLTYTGGLDVLGHQTPNLVKIDMSFNPLSSLNGDIYLFIGLLPFSVQFANFANCSLVGRLIPYDDFLYYAISQVTNGKKPHRIREAHQQY